MYLVELEISGGALDPNDTDLVADIAADTMGSPTHTHAGMLAYTFSSYSSASEFAGHVDSLMDNVTFRMKRVRVR